MFVFLIDMQILMNTFYPQTGVAPSFGGKTDLIPTQQILDLIHSELPVRQIAAKLQISVQSYYNLLNERGIRYNSQDGMSEILSRISVSEFKKMVDDRAPVSKICNAFEITVYAYRKLLMKLGIKGSHSALAAKAASITEEDLRKCINAKLSVEQICDKLNITRDIYYSKIKEFNIVTPRKATINHNKAITESQFKALIDKGTPYQVILDTLDITPEAYNLFVAKYNITTKGKQRRINIANIDRKTFTEQVLAGTPVKDVCNEFGINVRTYSRLLDKFDIQTTRKDSKARVLAVTKEQLQALVNDKSLSPEAICNELQISITSFYKLLKRLDIQYDYLHHHGEISIPVPILKKVSKSGMTVNEISDALGIATTTYNEKAKVAKVSTVFRESIDKIANVPEKEFQDAVDSCLSVKEICNRFGISHSNYKVLIRKRNTLTQQRASSERISHISKVDIQKWKDLGKSKEEICDILQISSGTYNRILSGRAGN